VLLHQHKKFVDPKQPSVDNPHMHIYGNSDLSNCFMHFDGNDTTGSAEEGYGEQVWPEQAKSTNRNGLYL
jgi:hypothetical protein